MKLNLGSGATEIPGYENVDRKWKYEAYPLPHGDNVCDIVRASHILEHFSHNEIGDVLIEWYRVLKPGGLIRIAVPDFEWIAKNYLDGEQINVQGLTMGGQTDANDYHKCIFDKEALTEALESAGFTSIQEWESEIEDCAALPVSLNLQGTKPVEKELTSDDIGACMSVPRLGFMDNFFCAFQALSPLKISMRKQTGAFWGQCLERAIEQTIEDGKSWILTIDYDTIFTKQDVINLIEIIQKYPEVDAVAALQVHRTRQAPLMTIKNDTGKTVSTVPLEMFDGDIAKINTAHFGLTLLNVDKLMKMPKPWFKAIPGPTGWDDERQDDDIYFWNRWEEAGNSLFLANRISVGHAELMIQWPTTEFKTAYQHPSEFYDKGKPGDVWK